MKGDFFYILFTKGIDLSMAMQEKERERVFCSFPFLLVPPTFPKSNFLEEDLMIINDFQKFINQF